MKWNHWSRKDNPAACCHKAGSRRPLSAFLADEQGIVISNPDARTTEMGFCHGTHLKVVCNEPGDENMVVIAGESRFAIPKTAAARIVLCSGGGEGHHKKGRHSPCSAT